MFSIDKEVDYVLVTGGTGFLGRHVAAELKSRGYENIVLTHTGKVENINWCNKNGFDQDHPMLTDFDDTHYCFDNYRPKAVINLAAAVGGIGANQKRPSEFTCTTLDIGTSVVRSILLLNNGCKLVQIGTVCSYPKHASIPFKEEDIWNGYPEETNAGYGIAKKAIMELVKQTNIQYPNKFNGINLIPVNLYGPGDNFDLQNSHVIPALIRKYVHAKENDIPNVFLWGTGEASREFLYVKDAARGIVDAMEKHEGGDPINLGTGREIKIKELAKLISSLVGYKGDTIYDTSKPDGQPRRCLNVDKAKRAFGFEAKKDFIEGLKETIEWYKNEWHTE